MAVLGGVTVPVPLFCVAGLQAISSEIQPDGTVWTGRAYRRFAGEPPPRCMSANSCHLCIYKQDGARLGAEGCTLHAGTGVGRCSCA